MGGLEAPHDAGAQFYVVSTTTHRDEDALGLTRAPSFRAADEGKVTNQVVEEVLHRATLAPGPRS